jgi:hypothetical protein
LRSRAPRKICRLVIAAPVHLLRNRRKLNALTRPRTKGGCDG